MRVMIALLGDFLLRRHGQVPGSTVAVGASTSVVKAHRAVVRRGV